MSRALAGGMKMSLMHHVRKCHGTVLKSLIPATSVGVVLAAVATVQVAGHTSSGSDSTDMLTVGLEGDELWLESQAHQPDDIASWDRFSASLDASGQWAVAGMPGADVMGSGSGSAVLLDLSSGAELMTLTAPDGSPGDAFGTSVGITESHVVIGAPGDDDIGSQSGAVYVFDRSTGAMLHKVVPSGVRAHDWFGSSVAVSGDLAIVGSPFDNDKAPDAGAAYVINVRTGDVVWKLTAEDANNGDNFGSSVSIDQSLIAVGSPKDDDLGFSSGSVLLFDATTGGPLLKLLPSEGNFSGFFGQSVSVGGATVLVGAPGDDHAGAGSGAAYVFDALSGVQWSMLRSPVASPGDAFGTSLDVLGSLAWVGAPNDDAMGEDAGASFVFDVLSGAPIATLIPDGVTSTSGAGASGALVPRRVLVGIPGDDASGENTGRSVLIVSTRSCPADLVGEDDVVDVSDLLELFRRWGSCDDCHADLNLDYSVDASDLLSLLASWGQCSG